MAQNLKDDIRSKILSSDSKKGKAEVIKFFGTEIEIRQPTLRDLVNYAGKEKTSFVDTLLEYAYVPGTNEKVFEEADRDGLLDLPFGEDAQRVGDVIAKFTNMSVDTAVKN